MGNRPEAFASPGESLLLRSLLFTCDCSPGPLVSPGIRMGPLPPHGEATTVPQPPIAPDVHQALDVHRDLAPERALHLVVVLDLGTDLDGVALGQILGLERRLDPDLA